MILKHQNTATSISAIVISYVILYAISYLEIFASKAVKRLRRSCLDSWNRTELFPFQSVWILGN